MKKTLIAFALAALSGHVFAQKVYVPGTFITGSAFTAMPSYQRQRYVAGVWDGLASAPILTGSNATKLLEFDSCAHAMNLDDAQLQAITEKYLSEHPERLNMPMAPTVIWALGEACVKIGHPVK